MRFTRQPWRIKTGALALLFLLLSAPCAGAADRGGSVTEGSAKGHGSLSIGYQSTAVDGLRSSNANIIDAGHGTMRSVQIDLEYFLSDAWSVRAGIPYVSNVFHGSPHCPTTAPPQCAGVKPLNPQRPESRFQDDGRYHGTWQDWTIGVAHHSSLRGNHLLTTALTAQVPSRNYTFFSNAAAGQRIWKIGASVELAHQFAFSNFYYRVGYGYVYTERVLDTRMSHHKLDLELGYFANERLTLRTFAMGKQGQGYTLKELGPLTDGRSNDYWYHHDQIIVHDFAEVGVGADYRIGGRYTVSAAYHSMIWGRSVNNFDHATELRLTREF